MVAGLTPGTAPRVAVIGAGYAGCAAAVELASRGVAVDVFEASRTLGGRARAAQINGFSVDNGQHILVGAYTETLRLMRTVGADADSLLKRIPLRFEFPGQFRMVAPKLPAPLHTLFALLRAQGIGWREKWAALHLMARLQRTGFKVVPDCTVTEWLDRQQTPYLQRRLLWEPLCIAALNTAADQASAQVLANVLRDSLAGTRAASDMLLPKTDLSALFPEPAADFVLARGGSVNRGIRLSGLHAENNGWRIEGTVYSQLVIAVAPYHLAALVPSLAVAVEHLAWEPIVTSYLAYPASVSLSQPMLGMVDGMAQWLFDRGQLCGQHGLIAAVISARGRHMELPAEELEACIHGEIMRVVPNLPPPLGAKTITEKRATFACTPNLQRPAAATGLPGVWLAGDYVASDYPATIEGAVRSGVSAARYVLGDLQAPT